MIAEMSSIEPTRVNLELWFSKCCTVLPLGEVTVEHWNGYRITNGICSSCYTHTDFLHESDIWEWSSITNETD